MSQNGQLTLVKLQESARSADLICGNHERNIST
jgi:hypothetical protein